MQDSEPKQCFKYYKECTTTGGLNVVCQYKHFRSTPELGSYSFSLSN